MTRINTNVSSLNAQKTLARSNAQLQQALTRLSTGLRINTGKDDPAGLIASETLKADITATNKAISNSQRANQMITTADSALGQISSLLNDIRGLVSEAANTGALSAEQIAANQLQIDSSLEAIDRIARVTTFQGKRLLDGNLDFVTTGVSNSQITNLQIDQATFGSQSQIDVAIDVVSQAKKAKLSYNSNTIASDVVLEVGGSEGYEAFTFAAGSSVADIASAINLVSDALGVRATTDAVRATADRAGQTNISAAGGSLKILSKTAGATAGNVGIVFTENGGPDADQLDVEVGTDGNLIVRLGVEAATTADTLAARDLNANAGEALLTIAARNAGSAFANVQLNIVDGGVGASTTATYDYKTKTITVTGDISTGVSGDDVEDAINDQLGTLFLATASGTDSTADVTAGNKGTFTGNATDKTLSSNNTLQALKDAIIADDGGTYETNANSLFDVSQSTGVLTGSLNQYALSAAYGSVNVGLASDSNNGIQIFGTSGAAKTAINFVKGAANSSLSISYTENTATGGYSTAYLQGVGATVKIQATEQGTQYDGLTVQFGISGSASDNSVIYDASAKTLTISYDATTDGEQLSATSIAAMINTTGLFTASIIGSGSGQISVGQTATTSGGNKYSAININLATDANGAITSTAADVITAINNSAELQALGYSATNLGSSNGTGLVSTGKTYLTQGGVTMSNSYASGTTYAAGGENSRLSVTAKVAGDAYDNIKITVYNDDSVTAGVNERVTYDANKKELAIYVDSGVSTVNDVLARFNTTNNPTEFAMFSLSALGSGEGVLTAGDEGVTSGGVVANEAAKTAVGQYASGKTSAAVNSQLIFTSRVPGAAYNDITVDLVDTVSAGSETFEYDAINKKLTIGIEDGASTVQNILDSFATADAGIRALFDISTLGDGTGTVTAGTDVATLAGGDAIDVASSVKMVENYDEGDEIGSVLTFESSEYGSSKFVSVKALSGSFATYNAAGTATDRDEGEDVSLRINGIAAVAEGLNVSFNTSSLDMRFSINANIVDGTRLNFAITGGGAQFQLGPDVLSNQQARIGIASISTTKLGNDTGRLYELRSGGTKSLTGDIGGAASVVEDVITQITTIRGRLGAFQKTTLDTNIAALTDTVETLTAAQSDIADADFAAESANMTRANILVQSGLTVLSNANQNPQNILKLLQ